MNLEDRIIKEIKAFYQAYIKPYKYETIIICLILFIKIKKASS